VNLFVFFTASPRRYRVSILGNPKSFTRSRFGRVEDQRGSTALVYKPEAPASESLRFFFTASPMRYRASILGNLKSFTRLRFGLVKDE